MESPGIPGRFRGGLLQLLGISLPPCRRFHPAGGSHRLSHSAMSPAAFARFLRARPPGSAFRGHISVHLHYGLVTRHRPSTALSMGFSVPVSLVRCHPSYGALTLTPTGLPPAEHASLCWTHKNHSPRRADRSSRAAPSSPPAAPPPIRRRTRWPRARATGSSNR